MDHKHCESCVSLGCTRRNGCPVVQCKNLCGFSMHGCKTKEHTSELCPRSLVPCVNAVYGCEQTMERRKLANHVQHCPASVLICKFPVTSRTDGQNVELSPSERLASVTRDPCQLLVRRDELSGHIQTYHLAILNAPLLFRRCPLARYGCEHWQPTLVPGPEGTSIDVKSQCLFVHGQDSECHAELTAFQAEQRRKQKELAMYGYAVPASTDSFEQLPSELLIKIGGFLDSLSLWSLSQTSYYMKEVCNKLVTKKGITVSAWEKQGSLWVQGPKWSWKKNVWTFSKVSSPVHSWLYADNASMSAHMMSCDCFKSVAVKYHSTEVWDIKELKMVPRHQADFNREEK